MFGIGKKKEVYHIYLFRHGKTTYNTKGIFTGWKNAKLTPGGIADAKNVAMQLKNKSFSIAIHTHLSRSYDTLKEVLKFHPECKLIFTDDRIIERDYGELDGLSHEKFIENIGNQLYKLEVEGDFFADLNPADKIKIKKFLGQKEYDMIHRGWSTRPPKGESFADVEKRVKKFIKWLKKYVKKNKVNVAISAHGNSIRLFRKIWEKTSKEEATNWFIPYDKVYEYKIKA